MESCSSPWLHTCDTSCSCFIWSNIRRRSTWDQALLDPLSLMWSSSWLATYHLELTLPVPKKDTHFHPEHLLATYTFSSLEEAMTTFPEVPTMLSIPWEVAWLSSSGIATHSGEISTWLAPNLDWTWPQQNHGSLQPSTVHWGCGCC